MGNVLQGAGSAAPLQGERTVASDLTEDGEDD